MKDKLLKLICLFIILSLFFIGCTEQKGTTTDINQDDVVENNEEDKSEPTTDKPAEFIISNIVLSSTEVEVDEVVSISADVKNVWDLEGEYTVDFLIDGEVKDSMNLYFDGGKTQKVTFNFSSDSMGSYKVKIGDLERTIDVVLLKEIGPLPPIDYAYAVVNHVGPQAYGPELQLWWGTDERVFYEIFEIENTKLNLLESGWGKKDGYKVVSVHPFDKSDLEENHFAFVLKDWDDNILFQKMYTITAMKFTGSFSKYTMGYYEIDFDQTSGNGPVYMTNKKFYIDDVEFKIDSDYNREGWIFPTPEHLRDNYPKGTTVLLADYPNIVEPGPHYIKLVVYGEPYGVLCTVEERVFLEY